jgi:ppGpp synthetase/RelA/SpoT-type nucleotidyltranferase
VDVAVWSVHWRGDDCRIMKSTALRTVLCEYQRRQAVYQELAEHLKVELKAIADELGIYPIISGRAKSIESLAEKLQRPGKKYGDEPLAELTDLCGVRVITHTLDQVQALSDRVRKQFVIDVVNSEDKQEKLAYREFGYLSKHYILEVPHLPGRTPERLGGLPPLKAELQLRTLSQHVWADVYHELGYKNEFRLPGRWEREFARLAALLETGDQRIQEIKDAMGTYETNYSAYMKRDELEALAQRLEAVLEIEPRNMSSVHRLIRTYLSLERGFERVRELASHYDISSNGPALRDAGVVYCQNPRKPGSCEFRKGQEFLRRAIELNPNDVDAICSLAGTVRREGRELEKRRKKGDARECYEHARELYRRDESVSAGQLYRPGAGTETGREHHLPFLRCFIRGRRAL